MSPDPAARRPLAARIADRWAAHAAGRLSVDGDQAAGCEPLSVGDPARGRQILSGRIRLAGHGVDLPGTALWEIAPPDAAFAAEAHGFRWLDDLAALGSRAARQRARDWTARWIARYGGGRGPGWQPVLTGRRLIRLMHHADFLAPEGADQDGDSLTAALHGALVRMGVFLARRAESARAGLPRFEALTGFLYAALGLTELRHHAGTASGTLAREAARHIGPDGGIESRNAEELALILTHLGWAVRALGVADVTVPPDLVDAIDRIAPCLRCLRHANGDLPRFHGADSGADGLVERALAASPLRPPPGHACRAMGYLRLSGGRSSVILDAAEPPGGAWRDAAHASTGAFELTSGRRPVVISCGPGHGFDHEWQLAARATQSHSALGIDGVSSSRLTRRRGSEALDDFARVIALQQAGGDGAIVQMTHDGWSRTHGLCATRELHLSADGRRLGGTDALAAHTPEQQIRLDARIAAARDEGSRAGIAFSIRFHLHPDARVAPGPGGATVRISLRSGEVWVFRHDGRARLSLEPSFCLHSDAEAPLGSRQIVLSAHAGAEGARIGWTLTKSRDTPLAIRDTARDDPEATEPN